jgi:hypothetical protein
MIKTEQKGECNFVLYFDSKETTESIKRFLQKHYEAGGEWEFVYCKPNPPEPEYMKIIRNLKTFCEERKVKKV